ncbi:MAG TPA: peptidylprolyl isomerase [Saprospiraceae bacterium]|nr:peptidylprolyl isomerase [Saprospiraceae bacterium]
MSTSRGDIEIMLFAEDSPGTVANFIKEARRKYYNNKTFHRVVPAFVIQGGCPRGDGYGSLGYTLRSEFFPYNYDDAGFVGMASAGNHTEGVQFFITHTATPHLDGNYTIFGKVIKGMDVVHKVGVGDQILTVNFEN